MITLKSIDVKKTYSVGLGDIQVPKDIYNGLVSLRDK